MSISPAPVPYWRLSAFYLFYFAILGIILPYWPLYLQDLGFDAEAIGYLSGIVMATKIIAPNFWGWLADRSGQHIRIIRSGALLGFCLFITVLINQSFWWLAVALAGFSFFWNAILSQFDVVTLRHLGRQYQRYGQVRLWGSVGFIATVMLLGWLFEFLSIRWVPWIVLACLAALWLSSMAIAEIADEDGHEQRQREAFIGVLKQPAVLAFMLCSFLLQMSHGPYYTFFSVYLEQLDYSRSAIGLLWSLGVLAEVLLFIIMHRLLVRFSLRQIMLVSLQLSALRWLLIAYYPEQLWLLLFAQCLHAASFGSYHSFAVEFIRRRFIGGSQGQGMALYSAVSFGAGGALGAVGSGWLWLLSSQLAYVAAAACCAIAFVVGYVAVLESKKVLKSV